MITDIDYVEFTLFGRFTAPFVAAVNNVLIVVMVVLT